jgi:hypothetical protein
MQQATEKPRRTVVDHGGLGAVGASLGTDHCRGVEFVGAGDHVVGECAQGVADFAEPVGGQFAAVLGGHEREHDLTDAGVHLSQSRQ